MNAHWSEDDFEYGDDGADSMVRPYTITRGRTMPERDDLTLITVLSTVVSAIVPGRRLQPEHRLILDRCRYPAAVAEVAADLNLPVSVTKILLGDLIAQGLLTARPPLAVAKVSGGVDLALLTAVRDGLRRL
ncbi:MULTISPECIES: DUF742 domain-containing protein [Kitasatospora]|uniref:DUF742 domain-containing protein n=1 Tax=Kitasatospora TaxID=2063 RepID=UPI000C705B9C|nr:DUF742 domain-containing protein [Kitasatospora sp. GP30]MDH6144419.1 hypothetical protein [Kitasatospora sp. GP30]